MKISENNFNVNKYQKQLAEFLADIEEQECIIYNDFNKQIFSGCKKNYDKIFDVVTGGIRIDDYEWALDNSPFKELFNKKNGDSLFYAIHLDDSVLLRGPKVYYYLVCYKEQHHNPTTKQIREWKVNILEFIDNVENTIWKIKNASDTKNSLLEKKYLLGILDYMRTLLLICFNAEMVEKNYENSYFTEHIKESSYFYSYFEELSICYSLFEELLFNEHYILKNIIKKLYKLIKKCNIKIERVFSKRIEDDNEVINERCFKLHREADSFIENYVTMKYAIFQLEEENRCAKFLKKRSIYGILNGAIEFPALFYYFCGQDNYNYYYVNISGDYLQRHKHKCSEANVENNLDKIGIIFDDNTMTGSTLELAYDYISINCNCSVEFFFLLRHPEINRIPQMKAYDKAVSIEFLKKKCIGLINHSPYSKIKYETNYYGEYLDELGIFTLTGEFFLRYLFKNGLYAKKSEVGHVGLFIQK